MKCWSCFGDRKKVTSSYSEVISELKKQQLDSTYVNTHKQNVVKEEVEIKEELKVTLLKSHAKVPTRGSPGAAGFDLYAVRKTVVPPYGKAVIDIGIAVQLPRGCYGRIAPRSGLAAKFHLHVAAGVIDSDYTGSLGVVLFNHSEESYKVSLQNNA